MLHFIINTVILEKDLLFIDIIVTYIQSQYLIECEKFNDPDGTSPDK